MHLNRERLVQLETRDQVSRRHAMQWVMAAVAAAAMPHAVSALPVGRTVTPQEDASSIPGHPGAGYGIDPKLTPIYRPGSFWPLIFNDSQRKTISTLADVIFPKDYLGPAASTAGVAEMIDEWISAPYPQQLADRPTILEGLAWLEAEATKRFGKAFSELMVSQRHSICDDICFIALAKPEFKKPATFFERFRSLCASAYYATPAGWAAIGYVGNTPLDHFDGPPAEVLEKLGVVQTVK